MVAIGIALFVIGLVVWINYSSKQNQDAQSNPATGDGTSTMGGANENDDGGNQSESSSDGGSDAGGDGGAD